MRTLAQRLGSGTATLYRHFDNRAALAAHVVDRMFGVVELNGEELLAMGWQQALRTVAHTMFDALARHRNAARLMAEQIPLGPHAMALREHCVAVLLDGGFPPRVAAFAYAALARYVLGFAVQVNGHGGARQLDESRSCRPAEWRGRPAWRGQLLQAGVGRVRRAPQCPRGTGVPRGHGISG